MLGLDAAAEDDLAARPSHHDGLIEHDHDDFDSAVFEISAIADSDAWLRRLVDIAEMAGVKAVRMDNVLFVTNEERADKLRKEEKDLQPNPFDDPTAGPSAAQGLASLRDTARREGECRDPAKRGHHRSQQG